MAYKILEDFWDQERLCLFKAGGFYPHTEGDAEWVNTLLSHRTKEGKPILKEVKGNGADRQVEGKA